MLQEIFTGTSRTSFQKVDPIKRVRPVGRALLLTRWIAFTKTCNLTIVYKKFTQ